MSSTEFATLNSKLSSGDLGNFSGLCSDVTILGYMVEESSVFLLFFMISLVTFLLRFKSTCVGFNPLF